LAAQDGGPDTEAAGEAEAARAAEAEQAAEGEPVAETVLLEDVIVTATRGEKRVSEAPGAVTVLGQEEIAARPSHTADTLLQAVPGLWFNREDDLNPGTTPVTLRGLANDRTTIMLDGVPLNDPRTNSANMDGISPESLERMEAVRGPMSALYGNGMAGVINFITSMPEKREFTLKTAYRSGFVPGTSYDNTLRAYVSYGDKLFDRLSLMVSYNRLWTEGFPTQLIQNASPKPGTEKEETADRTGKTTYTIGDNGNQEVVKQGLAARLKYDFNADTFFRFDYFWNDMKGEYGVPRQLNGDPVYDRTDNYGNNFSAQTNFSRMRNLFHGSFETTIAGFFTKLDVSLHDVRYLALTSGAGGYNGGAGSYSDAPARNYLGDWQVSTPQFLRQRFTFGLTGKLDTGETIGGGLRDWRDGDSITQTEYTSKDAEPVKKSSSVSSAGGGKAASVSVYLQDEISVLDNLGVYIGGRADYWSVFDGYTQNFSNSTTADKWNELRYDDRGVWNFSPKAAVVFSPLDITTLRLSGGKSFNTPTLYQLFGVYVASSGSVYQPNPELKPETVWSWDMSVTQDVFDGRLSVSLGYFENYIQDLIVSGSSAAPIIVDGNAYGRDNISDAVARGIEAGLKLKLFNSTGLTAHYTWTRARVTGDRNENSAINNTEGNEMQYVPEHAFNAGIDFTWKKLNAYLGGRYFSKRYGQADNSDTENGYGSYSPYFLMDAKVSCRFTDHFSLSLTGNNITNTRYYNYYQGSGASWGIEAAVAF
jgi:iron complex outermembrane receptor protein